jgi:FKBP-type peptidyl-prolyl cis-trans isomerase (trigger factor)
LLAGLPAHQQITKGQVHRGKEEVLESKENVLVEVGSGISPFDGGIHGMVAGEEREVVATDSSLATSGKRYKIKVKEVKVKILPALDDEFSKTVGYNSILELKKAVKERLEEDARQRTEREFRDRIFDALIEKNPIEAPSSMVEDHVEYMVAEMKRMLGTKAGQIDENKMREEKAALGGEMSGHIFLHIVISVMMMPFMRRAVLSNFSQKLISNYPNSFNIKTF